MLLLSWKNVGKTLFSVSDLLVSKTFVCEKIRFGFPLFLKLLFLISLLSALNYQNHTKTSFFVFVQTLFVSLFLFQLFSFFLFHHCCLCSISPFIFLFIPLCFSLFFLVSPSPRFLYISISVFLFPFFFSTWCFLICFFSIAFFCVFPFLFLKHSSFLPFDLDLFVFLFLLYHFVFISVSAFFLLKKKFKIFCGQFFEDEKMSFFFFFWTFPFSEFFLVCFPPCVVIFPCLPNVFCFFTILHYFLSSFSFTNLLFGPLQKNRFVFEKVKNHWFSSQYYSFWKTFFPDFNHFSV